MINYLQSNHNNIGISTDIFTDKFIEYFYVDKKLVHLQILEMIKIGIVEKEHACLHGNLNFYRNNKKKYFFNL